MTDTTELKPCPFCGGPASITAEPHDGPESEPRYYPHCLNYVCAANLRSFSDARIAIRTWNKRSGK